MSSRNYYLKCPTCQNEPIHINDIFFSHQTKSFKIETFCTSTSKVTQTPIHNLLETLYNPSLSSFPKYCDYHPYTQVHFFNSFEHQPYCTDCYLESITTEPQCPFKSPPSTCKAHPLKPIINFCKRCNTYICETCLTSAHQTHCIWNTISPSITNHLNTTVNTIITNMQSFYSNSLNNINALLNSIFTLKANIRTMYHNYMNVYLPLINLYKVLLHDNYRTPHIDIINSLMKFDWTHFMMNNNFNETTTKLNNEFTRISTQLSTISYGYDLVFSQQKFKCTHYAKINVHNESQHVYMYLDNNTGTNHKTYQHANMTRNIATLNGHSGTIYSLISLVNGDFASSSADGSVIVWDRNSLKMNVQLFAHKESINSLLQVNNDILITCANDCMIKLWSISKHYELIDSIRMKMPVISLMPYINDDSFISFHSNVITLWSVQSCTQLHEMVVDKSPSLVVQLKDKNCFVTAFENGEIEVYHLYGDTKKRSLERSNESEVITAAVEMKGMCLVGGTYEGDLLFWNVATCKCEFHIMKAHLYVIQDVIELYDGVRFITASNDKSMKVWDVETKECVCVFTHAHDRAIRCLLQLNDKRVVSGSSDETVKVWGT